MHHVTLLWPFINHIEFIMKLVMVYHQTMIDPPCPPWGCCPGLHSVSQLSSSWHCSLPRQTGRHYWSVRNNLTQIPITPVQCTPVSELNNWTSKLHPKSLEKVPVTHCLLHDPCVHLDTGDNTRPRPGSGNTRPLWRGVRPGDIRIIMSFHFRNLSAFIAR